MCNHKLLHDGVVVVGAGIAGLTIAQILAENKIPVTVVERCEAVGGLARSFRYGDCIFDIGPHRFHSDNQAVISYIRKILPNELEDIPRKSGVWFFGKYYDWPLGPMTILRLPRRILLRVCRDLVSLLSRRGEITSFEAHIVNMFGGTLYDTFFKDYTTKFLGITPDRTHADWAKTGIDRAIIDERLQMKTLWQLIFSLFRPQPDTRFLYPTGGIGRFCDALAERLTACGGTIITGAPVTGLRHDQDRISGVQLADRPFLPASHVVWTAPLPLLARFTGTEPTDLRYLAMVIYNLVLDQPHRMRYQWCYYGDFDLIFNRISDPSAFSVSTAPPGKYPLCVEITTGIDSAIWNDPGICRAELVEQLARVKLIDSPETVQEFHWERIPDSYPVYDIEYPEKLRVLTERLNRFSNLTMAGRTGLFWYNNMDHSMENAFTTARRLLEQRNKAQST
ncbi:FAD-dependent oxidoreductase [bacterium]|nr:FAD-dependent oxidoreductase [candidate division CSSED10-310 bacterium]